MIRISFLFQFSNARNSDFVSRPRPNENCWLWSCNQRLQYCTPKKAVATTSCLRLRHQKNWPSIECYITFAENYRNGLSMTKSSPCLPPPCSLIIANLFQTVLHEKLQFNFTNQCGFQVSSRLSYFKQNFVEFCIQGFKF